MIKKLKSSELTHKLADAVFKHIPLPKIHPNIISFLSLCFSVVFLFKGEYWYQLIILSIVWLFDILDGVVARKYQFRKNTKDQEKGWLIDVTIDRLSEGIISIAYFMPLFPLFIVNTILSVFSYKKKIHLILPIRQLLLLYLVIKLIIN